MIDSITAEGQTVTIKTQVPKPTLLNSLSDPYGCIIDMQAGITEDGIVTGTGPYQVVSLTSGEKLELKKNETYWDGEPGFDQITVRTISDGPYPRGSARRITRNRCDRKGFLPASRFG